MIIFFFIVLGVYLILCIREYFFALNLVFKVCRKGLKERYFFLFNDMLLYGLKLATGQYTWYVRCPLRALM